MLSEHSAGSVAFSNLFVFQLTTYLDETNDVTISVQEVVSFAIHAHSQQRRRAREQLGSHVIEPAGMLQYISTVTILKAYI